MQRLQWTDEMRAQLKRLLAAGMSYRAAAAEMGIRHSQAKGAAIYNGMTPATPRAPWRDWDRAEYDHLDHLLEQGLGYAKIALIMNITRTQAKGAAQRLGLMRSDRIGKHRVRTDWAEIDRIAEDCIEARLMTVPQAHRHLKALGYDMGLSTLYSRVRENAALKRQADSNAQRRKSEVGARVQAGRHAKRKRLKREAA